MRKICVEVSHVIWGEPVSPYIQVSDKDKLGTEYFLSFDVLSEDARCEEVIVDEIFDALYKMSGYKFYAKWFKYKKVR